MDIQVHEAYRSSHKFNPKKPSLRHIIIELSKIKNKEKILKAARENISHTRESHKAISGFLSRNLASKE